MARRTAGSRDLPVHPSTAAIAGHPIHPMLVPLPIGLLSAAAVSDLAAVATGDRFFARASRLLLGGGIATALTAAPFGAVDFLTIDAARRRPEAWLHGLGNLGVVAISGVNLALRRQGDAKVTRTGVALSAAAAFMLLVTGWLGGELSYRHRIGVAGSGGEEDGAGTGAGRRARTGQADERAGAVGGSVQGGEGAGEPALVAD